MNPTTSENKDQKKGREKPTFGAARKIGYIAVIIIMIVILYLLRNYEKWHIPFLTPEFSRCLFYIELSIYGTIAAQVLFILYDKRWFRHLVQVLTGILGALSIIMIYVIFPFEPDIHWLKWIRIGLLIIFGFTLLGIIIDLAKGIRYLLKDPQAI